MLDRRSESDVWSYHGADRQDMAKFVPASAQRILELGCGAGNFGKLLKQRHNVTVWGIELNPAAAALAQRHLDGVLVGDLVQVMEQLPSTAFDCVVANDVLEHLAYPDQVLQQIQKHIAPRGVVVASIPHIRHWKALYEIVILADFRYRDSGTFDRTHFRFFTKKSIRRLFEEAGYTVDRIELQTPSGPAAFVPLTLLNVLFLGAISDWRYSHIAVVARLVS